MIYPHTAAQGHDNSIQASSRLFRDGGCRGMAAGAGLPILAVAATCGHFVVVFIFPAIERNLPTSRWAPSPVHISYEPRRGALREILSPFAPIRNFR